MAGLYRETTLSKEDMDFMRIDLTPEQIGNINDYESYQRPKEWMTSPADSERVLDQKYTIRPLKDFYTARDDPNAGRMMKYSRLRFQEMTDLSNSLISHDEFGPLSDTDKDDDDDDDDDEDDYYDDDDDDDDGDRRRQKSQLEVKISIKPEKSSGRKKNKSALKKTQK